MSVVTTTDVVISDVVILATSESPVSTALTAAAGSSTSASAYNPQLKLKVNESGIGLIQEQLSSEVRYQCHIMCIPILCDCTGMQADACNLW